MLDFFSLLCGHLGASSQFFSATLVGIFKVHLQLFLTIFVFSFENLIAGLKKTYSDLHSTLTDFHQKQKQSLHSAQTVEKTWVQVG
jgi:hypothetical protein